MMTRTTQEKVAELRKFYRWMPERQFRRLIKKMYICQRTTFKSYYGSNDKGQSIESVYEEIENRPLV
jgi:hypothetical protein